MKIALIIVRTLMGLLFLFASIAVLFRLVPQPELTGDVKIFNDGMAASVYLMPLVKVIELLCGIAFVSGRFVPLATVIIAPIVVNILLFHAFLAPEGLPVAIFLFLGNLFLAYAYRKNYEPLLAVK
jgi:uncharacterized membrane protein YphA (DoxX/SURF4 family)